LNIKKHDHQTSSDADVVNVTKFYTHIFFSQENQCIKKTITSCLFGHTMQTKADSIKKKEKGEHSRGSLIGIEQLNFFN